MVVQCVVAEHKSIQLALAWPTDTGLVIGLYLGHLVEQAGSNDENCCVLIDDVVSCRIESETLSTKQLPVSDLPADVQAEVNRLIGRTLGLNRLFTELKLLQYINPP